MFNLTITVDNISYTYEYENIEKLEDYLKEVRNEAKGSKLDWGYSISETKLIKEGKLNEG